MDSNALNERKFYKHNIDLDYKINGAKVIMNRQTRTKNLKN